MSLQFKPRDLSRVLGAGPKKQPQFTLWVTKTGGYGPGAKFAISWFNDPTRALTRGEVIAALRATAARFEEEGRAEVRGSAGVSN